MPDFRGQVATEEEDRACVRQAEGQAKMDRKWESRGNDAMKRQNPSYVSVVWTECPVS